MALEGAKFICLDEAGNHGEVVLAKGRKFTVGYYVNCDFVLVDERARGIHCEIECDALGRVTVRNLSPDNPILVNGSTVEIKRILLTNSKLSILDKEYLWQFPEPHNKEFKDLAIESSSTPEKKTILLKQPPNSCPDFKLHRDIPKRFTVHNFAYCIHSDEEGNISSECNDENANTEEQTIKTDNELKIGNKEEFTKNALINMELYKNQTLSSITPEPVKQLAKSSAELLDTSKMNLINCTIDKENNNSEKKNKQLKMCHHSDVVITSFSPRLAGVKIEKSFATVVKPKVLITKTSSTPKSIYSTPKSEMNANGKSEVDLIAFYTPSTSKKGTDMFTVSDNALKNSSMHLIDLTTPSKLAPSSSHLKSAVKVSGKKNITKTIDTCSTKFSSKEQLGLSTLPVTPVITEASALETPSVISVNSSVDISSVIEVTSDASNLGVTPRPASGQITPLKAKHFAEACTPKKGPQSLKIRALLTSIKKQNSESQINAQNPSTPSRNAINRIRNNTDSLRTPTSSQTSTAKLISHLHRRQSMSTPRRSSINPISAAKVLPTSTPVSGSALRTRTACKTSLFKVRKSSCGTPVSSSKSIDSKFIVMSASASKITSIKDKSPQQVMSNRLLARARKSFCVTPILSKSDFVEAIKTSETCSPSAKLKERTACLVGKSELKAVFIENTQPEASSEVHDLSRTFIIDSNVKSENEERCIPKNVTFSPKKEVSNEEKQRLEIPVDVEEITNWAKEDNEHEDRNQTKNGEEISVVDECNKEQPGTRNSANNNVHIPNNAKTKSIVTEESFAEIINNPKEQNKTVADTNDISNSCGKESSRIKSLCNFAVTLPEVDVLAIKTSSQVLNNKTDIVAETIGFGEESTPKIPQTSSGKNEKETINKKDYYKPEELQATFATHSNKCVQLHAIKDQINTEIIKKPVLLQKAVERKSLDAQEIKNKLELKDDGQKPHEYKPIVEDITLEGSSIEIETKENDEINVNKQPVHEDITLERSLLQEKIKCEEMKEENAESMSKESTNREMLNTNNTSTHIQVNENVVLDENLVQKNMKGEINKMDLDINEPKISKKSENNPNELIESLEINPVNKTIDVTATMSETMQQQNTNYQLEPSVSFKISENVEEISEIKENFIADALQSESLHCESSIMFKNKHENDLDDTSKLLEEIEDVLNKSDEIKQKHLIELNELEKNNSDCEKPLTEEYESENLVEEIISNSSSEEKNKNLKTIKQSENLVQKLENDMIQTASDCVSSEKKENNSLKQEQDVEIIAERLAENFDLENEISKILVENAEYSKSQDQALEKNTNNEENTNVNLREESSADKDTSNTVSCTSQCKDEAIKENIAQQENTGPSEQININSFDQKNVEPNETKNPKKNDFCSKQIVPEVAEINKHENIDLPNLNATEKENSREPSIQVKVENQADVKSCKENAEQIIISKIGDSTELIINKVDIENSTSFTPRRSTRHNSQSDNTIQATVQLPSTPRRSTRRSSHSADTPTELLFTPKRVARHVFQSNENPQTSTPRCSTRRASLSAESTSTLIPKQTIIRRSSLSVLNETRPLTPRSITKRRPSIDDESLKPRTYEVHVSKTSRKQLDLSMIIPEETDEVASDAVAMEDKRASIQSEKDKTPVIPTPQKLSVGCIIHGEKVHNVVGVILQEETEAGTKIEQFNKNKKGIKASNDGLVGHLTGEQIVIAIEDINNAVENSSNNVETNFEVQCATEEKLEFLEKNLEVETPHIKEVLTVEISEKKISDNIAIKSDNILESKENCDDTSAAINDSDAVEEDNADSIVLRKAEVIGNLVETGEDSNNVAEYAVEIQEDQVVEISVGYDNIKVETSGAIQQEISTTVAKNILAELPKIPLMAGMHELLKTPKSESSTRRLDGSRYLVRTPKEDVAKEEEENKKFAVVPDLIRTPVTHISEVSTQKAQTRVTIVADSLKTPTPRGEFASIHNLLESEERPSTSKKVENLEGIKELLKTPKTFSTPCFKGVRELMQTPKNSSTPIMSNIKELLQETIDLQTSKELIGSPPTHNINKELEKFLRTPSAKNIMIPSMPSSAVIEKSSDSVEISTEYNLNATNNECEVTNLEDLFKTTVGSHFTDRITTDSYCGEDETECSNVIHKSLNETLQDTLNKSSEDAFDKLVGQENQIQTPVRKMYARKSFTLQTPHCESPFSAADVLTDLPKTDVEEWIQTLDQAGPPAILEYMDGDDVGNSEEVVFQQNIIESGEEMGNVSSLEYSSCAKDEQTLCSNESIIPETCTKIYVTETTRINQPPVIILDAENKDPISHTNTKLIEKQACQDIALLEVEISGIDLLDQTVESIEDETNVLNKTLPVQEPSMLEAPLVVSDDSEIEISITEVETSQDEPNDLSEPLVLLSDSEDLNQSHITDTNYVENMVGIESTFEIEDVEISNVDESVQEKFISTVGIDMNSDPLAKIETKNKKNSFNDNDNDDEGQIRQHNFLQTEAELHTDQSKEQEIILTSDNSEIEIDLNIDNESSSSIKVLEISSTSQFHKTENVAIVDHTNSNLTIETIDAEVDAAETHVENVEVNEKEIEVVPIESEDVFVDPSVTEICEETRVLNVEEHIEDEVNVNSIEQTDHIDESFADEATNKDNEAVFCEQTSKTHHNISLSKKHLSDDNNDAGAQGSISYTEEKKKNINASVNEVIEMKEKDIKKDDENSETSKENETNLEKGIEEITPDDPIAKINVLEECIALHSVSLSNDDSNHSNDSEKPEIISNTKGKKENINISVSKVIDLEEKYIKENENAETLKAIKVVGNFETSNETETDLRKGLEETIQYDQVAEIIEAPESTAASKCENVENVKEFEQKIEQQSEAIELLAQDDELNSSKSSLIETNFCEKNQSSRIEQDFLEVKQIENTKTSEVTLLIDPSPACIAKEADDMSCKIYTNDAVELLKPSSSSKQISVEYISTNYSKGGEIIRDNLFSQSKFESALTNKCDKQKKGIKGEVDNKLLVDSSESVTDKNVPKLIEHTEVTFIEPTIDKTCSEIITKNDKISGKNCSEKYLNQTVEENITENLGEQEYLCLTKQEDANNSKENLQHLEKEIRKQNIKPLVINLLEKDSSEAAAGSSDIIKYDVTGYIKECENELVTEAKMEKTSVGKNSSSKDLTMETFTNCVTEESNLKVSKDKKSEEMQKKDTAPCRGRPKIVKKPNKYKLEEVEEINEHQTQGEQQKHTVSGSPTEAYVKDDENYTLTRRSGRRKVQYKTVEAVVGEQKEKKEEEKNKEVTQVMTVQEKQIETPTRTSNLSQNTPIYSTEIIADTNQHNIQQTTFIMEHNVLSAVVSETLQEIPTEEVHMTEHNEEIENPELVVEETDEIGIEKSSISEVVIAIQEKSANSELEVENSKFSITNQRVVPQNEELLSSDTIGEMQNIPVESLTKSIKEDQYEEKKYEVVEDSNFYDLKEQQQKIDVEVLEIKVDTPSNSKQEPYKKLKMTGCKEEATVLKSNQDSLHEHDTCAKSKISQQFMAEMESEIKTSQSEANKNKIILKSEIFITEEPLNVLQEAQKLETKSNIKRGRKKVIKVKTNEKAANEFITTSTSHKEIIESRNEDLIVAEVNALESEKQQNKIQESKIEQASKEQVTKQTTKRGRLRRAETETETREVADEKGTKPDDITSTAISVSNPYMTRRGGRQKAVHAEAAVETTVTSKVRSSNRNRKTPVESLMTIHKPELPVVNEKQIKINAEGTVIENYKTPVQTSMSVAQEETTKSVDEILAVEPSISRKQEIHIVKEKPKESLVKVTETRDLNAPETNTDERAIESSVEDESNSSVKKLNKRIRSASDCSQAAAVDVKLTNKGTKQQIAEINESTTSQLLQKNEYISSPDEGIEIGKDVAEKSQTSTRRKRVVVIPERYVNRHEETSIKSRKRHVEQNVSEELQHADSTINELKKSTEYSLLPEVNLESAKQVTSIENQKETKIKKARRKAIYNENNAKDNELSAIDNKKATIKPVEYDRADSSPLIKRRVARGKPVEEEPETKVVDLVGNIETTATSSTSKRIKKNFDSETVEEKETPSENIETKNIPRHIARSKENHGELNVKKLETREELKQMEQNLEVEEQENPKRQSQDNNKKDENPMNDQGGNNKIGKDNQHSREEVKKGRGRRKKNDQQEEQEQSKTCHSPEMKHRGRRRKASTTDSQDNTKNENEEKINTSSANIEEHEAPPRAIAAAKKVRKIVEHITAESQEVENIPNRRARNVPQRRAATAYHNYDETSDTEVPTKIKKKTDSPRKSVESVKKSPTTITSASIANPSHTPSSIALTTTARGRTRKPTAKVQQFLEEERAKAETPKKRALLAAAAAASIDTATPQHTPARRGRKASTIEIDVESTPQANKSRGRAKAIALQAREDLNVVPETETEEVAKEIEFSTTPLPTNASKGRRGGRKAKISEDEQHNSDEPPNKKSSLELESEKQDLLPVDEMPTPLKRIAGRRNAAAAAKARIEEDALAAAALDPPKKARVKKVPAKISAPVMSAVSAKISTNVESVAVPKDVDDHSADVVEYNTIEKVKNKDTPQTRDHSLTSASTVEGVEDVEDYIQKEGIEKPINKRGRKAATITATTDSPAVPVKRGRKPKIVEGVTLADTDTPAESKSTRGRGRGRKNVHFDEHHEAEATSVSQQYANDIESVASVDTSEPNKKVTRTRRK